MDGDRAVKGKARLFLLLAGAAGAFMAYRALNKPAAAAAHAPVIPNNAIGPSLFGGGPNAASDPRNSSKTRTPRAGRGQARRATRANPNPKPATAVRAAPRRPATLLQ
jgi:hypothetical protein